MSRSVQKTPDPSHSSQYDWMISLLKAPLLLMLSFERAASELYSRHLFISSNIEAFLSCSDAFSLRNSVMSFSCRAWD